MKKITALFLSMIAAASMIGYSADASAWGHRYYRGYYHHTYYRHGYYRNSYYRCCKPRCCPTVPSCCRHETPCRSCGCGGFFGLF